MNQTGLFGRYMPIKENMSIILSKFSSHPKSVLRTAAAYGWQLKIEVASMAFTLLLYNRRLGFDPPWPART